jgi:5-methylcytosine-specific restriction endonuclease McrA
MPWAVKRPCTTPGCREFQPCPTHKPKPRQWGHDKRPNAGERGYSADWQKVRKQALKAARFECNRCGSRAVVVHHIVPVDEAPDRRLDPSNLECLCRSCHEKHHGRA